MKGAVELTLATLPLSEFDIYWQPMNWTDEYVLKTKPQNQTASSRAAARVWLDRKGSVHPRTKP
jgi:hypothetical protein